MQIGEGSGVDFDDLAEEFSVELILLFGSLAKGRERAESDLDLAVLRRRGTPRWTLDELCNLEFRLWQRADRDREIDLVDISNASPLLLGEIAGTGRLLYQATPVSLARFRSWAMRRCEDSNKWFKRREAALRRRLCVA